MDVHLLVFCKAPVAGQVKTRLAAGIGARAALDAYRAMAANVLAAADASGLPSVIYYTPAREQDGVRGLCGPHRTYRPQTPGHGAQGDDLGARMAAALKETLARSDGALLVGSDLPLVTGPVLAQAARALATHDAVLGPATDGGYWAIGFTRRGFCPEVFAAMPWSTSDVAALTRERLDAAGRSLALLPELPDCDRPEDLSLLAGPPWRDALAGTPFGRFLALRPGRDV